MLFYLLFVFGLIIFAPETNASYMCTGIHTFFNTTYGNNTQTLLHFETDLLYSGNPAGYETITLKNQKLYIYNSSYGVFGVQQESYGQQEVFQCANVTGDCSLIVADGNGLFNLGVTIGDVSDWLMMVDVAYFRGTVFWEIGLVLTPDDGCVETIDIDFDFPQNYNTNGMYCCNRWEQLPEAPPADNTCLEFTSNIEYYNQSMSLANLTMQYYFDTGKNITIMGKSFTSPLPYLQFDHNVNYAFQDCQGNLNNPKVACVAPMEFNDAVYSFYADVTGYTSGTWHAIAGAVEYRFGQLMRNGSDPFTPQNPCYQYTFDASVGGAKAFDKTVDSRSNMCCTKWQNPVSTTPATPSPQTPSSGGQNYLVSFQIANSTNFGRDTLATLNATLSVDQSNYYFAVTSYNSFMNSSYHVYIFANQFLTEDCLGSSAQTCTLPQSDGQAFPWFLSTSFAPDGFRLFTTTAQNGKLTVPELGPNEQCYYIVNPYNYPYPPLYVQATICINN